MRITTLLSALILIAAFAGSVHGQLLFREEMEQENYARTGYNQYGRTMVSRSTNPRYDYFGNYILNGVSLFHWEEEKNTAQLTARDFSLVDKLNPVDESPYFTRYLDEFVVMNETNRAFSSRFIVGSRIRAKFSPLTLDMTTLNGVRWDTNFANNNITLVASRASLPMFTSSEFRNSDVRLEAFPVYLHGGHIERKMGIFNVSANYVNTYLSNSRSTRSNNSLTGTLQDEAYLGKYKPVQLAVKVEDGSNFDGGGPRVYDIFPVINGVERPELLVAVTKGNWQDDFLTSSQSNNLNRDSHQNRFMLDPLRAPDFFKVNSLTTQDDPEDYNILKRRYYNPDDPDNDPIVFSELNETGKEYLECNGEDYLVFWFDLPQTAGDEIEEVVIKSLVSNNYIFSVAEIYSDTDSEIDATTELGKVSATFFEKVYFSEGDVKDESNFGWISFEHGAPTANMLMSFRVDAEIKGFRLVSEYSRNLQYKQYKNLDSQKFTRDAEAYYINITKEFGNFEFGTEYFKMDPNYTTTFRHTDPEYNVIGPSWSLYKNPTLNRNLSTAGGPQSVLNLTNLISTVDDNDDKDQLPDYHMFQSFMDLNGVYPGLDKNGNNRPDVNENDNLKPDYDEPFFLFNVDPDEYDYGLDLNNNSVIDERENDTKPDYPYDVDRKGFHVFGSYGQDMGWKYTLGYLNMESIAGAGETDSKYAIAEYQKFIPFFADIKFATMIKRVEDSIEDDVIRYARHLSTTLVDSLTYGYNTFSGGSVIDPMMGERYFDPLLYRDSYVSKSYFETNIFTVPNLTMGVKLKYDLNHQNETSFQSENDIADRTQIYRAEYKYYLKNLLIQPQVKYLTRKYTSQSKYSLPLHEQYFYPIIRIEYPLTMRTTLKAGVQGFPGLNATVRNLVNDQLDYDMRNTVVMLTNRSFYSGYDFSLNFGFESRWQSFNGVARQVFNRTDRFYFVRLVVGLEPIS